MNANPDAATYVIKTKDGQKGPFTRKQICKLVVKGQLPETVSVRDVEQNQSVLVADIVSGAAYKHQFEQEALGIASDLMEEVSLDDGYGSGAQKVPLQNDKMDKIGSGRHRSPSSSQNVSTGRRSRSADEHTASGRRTQSHKRRSAASSRVFESDIVENVSRSRRKSNKQQSMYITIGVVVVCAIVAVVLVLMPRGDMKGVWTQGQQTLKIGQTVIKLTEGTEVLIHDHYTEVQMGDKLILETTWQRDGFPQVKIGVDVNGDSLTTTYDGSNPLFWKRSGY